MYMQYSMMHFTNKWADVTLHLLQLTMNVLLIPAPMVNVRIQISITSAFAMVDTLVSIVKQVRLRYFVQISTGLADKASDHRLSPLYGFQSHKC